MILLLHKKTETPLKSARRKKNRKTAVQCQNKFYHLLYKLLHNSQDNRPDKNIFLFLDIFVCFTPTRLTFC